MWERHNTGSKLEGTYTAACTEQDMGCNILFETDIWLKPDSLVDFCFKGFAGTQI
jgi:hypothetical protein